MKYQINAKLFNATIAAQSTGDRRFYLQAFFVSYDNAELVATDGNIMAVSPLDPTGEIDPAETIPDNNAVGKGWIFAGVAKPLLRSAELVEIDTLENRLEITGVKYKGPRYTALERINASYVNYRSVKADNDTTEQVKSEVGLNVELAFRCFKWAGYTKGDAQARFIFPKEQGKAIEIRPTGKSTGPIRDLHITLMPVRL